VLKSDVDFNQFFSELGDEFMNEIRHKAEHKKEELLSQGYSEKEAIGLTRKWIISQYDNK